MPKEKFTLKRSVPHEEINPKQKLPQRWVNCKKCNQKFKPGAEANPKEKYALKRRQPQGEVSHKERSTPRRTQSQGGVNSKAQLTPKFLPQDRVNP